jgi:NAD+ kinase
MNSSFGSYRSPKTIALVGKYHSLEIAESLRRLAEYLHERGFGVHRTRNGRTSVARSIFHDGLPATSATSARMPTLPS